MEPRPWQASIQATLSRAVGVDQVEEVDYASGGEFTRRLRVAGGPGPQNIQVLQDDALHELLAAVRTQLRGEAAGVDGVGLRVFVDLIEDRLRAHSAASTP